MSSKKDILGRIRKELPQAVELPSLQQDWIQYDDIRQQFIDAVASVGGSCVVVASLEEIQSHLAQIESYASGQNRVSLVDGVGTADIDFDSIGDPHDLEACDWAVVPAEIGVAENGAIWLTDRAIKHRAVLFIVQHLAIVLSINDLVHNMAEAYDRINCYDSVDGTPSLGVFISGPSKTADIEQSLVIGAHGSRSHIVFLLDDHSAAN